MKYMLDSIVVTTIFLWTWSKLVKFNLIRTNLIYMIRKYSLCPRI